MLVKVALGDDIRRFTIDHPFITFQALENQLATLYKLPKGTFRISYRDEENDKVAISTSDELNAAIGTACIGHQNILRLNLDVDAPNVREREEPDNNSYLFNSTDLGKPGASLEQKESGSAPSQQSNNSQSFNPFFALKELISSNPFTNHVSTGTNTSVPSMNIASTNTPSLQTSSSSTNTTSLPTSSASTNTKKVVTSSSATNTREIPIEDINMDELFASPRFQEKLATILSHAIATRAFSQLLQAMIPQMTDILRDTIRGTATNTAVQVPEVEEVPEVEVKEVNLPKYIDDGTPLVTRAEPFDSSKFVSLEDIECSSRNTTPSITPVSSSHSTIELPVETHIWPKEDQKVETLKIVEQEIKEPEPEPFVMVNENQENRNQENKNNEKPAPLFTNFLSIFKGSKSASSVNVQPEPVATEEAPIVDMENIIAQLEAMGFTDREQNIKAIRFHKKFNEGLDEIVEDLLRQAIEKQ